MKNILKKILVFLLQKEAELALKRHKPIIVAVTGSVGKTSAKDAIASALSETERVRKSEKSFNSEIGIPLTILGLKNPWSNPVRWLGALALGIKSIFSNTYPKILVLEIGADKPGDISSLKNWLVTDVVVATQFAKVPVHIENFPSRDAVLREKLSLIGTLKSGGSLILNTDDSEFYEKARTLHRSAKIYTYGLVPPAKVIGSNEKYIFDKYGRVRGFSFKIEHSGTVLPLEIEGAVGTTHMYPSLAGFAVGIALNLNPISLLEGLRNTRREPGRMRIIPGIKKTVVLDDSYNASPIATARALDTLDIIPSNGRKIAILGDMLELGEHTESEHKKAGKRAADFVDILVSVGRFARYTAEGALNAGMSEKSILQFESAEEAGKYIELLLKAGDTILIKGSQGSRMERAVLEIMESPQQKRELLARQDPEWLKR